MHCKEIDCVSGDIAAAWIEQRCRSSAVGDIDWDKVLSVPRNTGTYYYESVQRWVQKEEKFRVALG